MIVHEVVLVVSQGGRRGEEMHCGVQGCVVLHPKRDEAGRKRLIWSLKDGRGGPMRWEYGVVLVAQGRTRFEEILRWRV